jgi:hypothetical protein
MLRWFGFLLAVLVGIAAGLYYGWVINSVKYVDAAPSSLRSDYRADYVLMVAEAYQAEGDLALAARRLALLGDTPPPELVQQAMIYASQAAYTDTDLTLLSRLSSDLQAWDPAQRIPEP